VSLPTPREVLALQAAAPAAAGAGRGIPEAPALEWEGRARTLRSSGSPAFPEILVREGRDVDVEALFAVAPDGRVLRVDIVRGSGYAAVDREVEKTVQGYLFEPASEGSEDTGRVRCRFRVERER